MDEATSSSDTGNPKLQWLIVLAPVVGAMILYLALRIRNARHRSKQTVVDTEARAEMSPSRPMVSISSASDLPIGYTPSMPPPSFTAHTLGRDDRGRIHIPSRPLIRFSTASLFHYPQGSTASLGTSSTSSSYFWRRFHRAGPESRRPSQPRRERRRRRRDRTPPTPPPIYSGSPPPNYEDIMQPRSEAEPSSRTDTERTVNDQAEDEPLVHLQQRLASSDPNA
ncbi:uncharacterized protein BYT42DRAFT_552919 [Radiomyces spectabilis]|uniref:uncharacterized protein n=1 Tax=Radiomyces spectabilis TaxID=64574 RepID=UPI00221F272C|nr:uncharacterized protein BYT42DRAFT_552919 [Radiomyces spectabilis]KAI8393973.1 hypothetical protein BYT42DRAFT_552919 [Radiomyces spectabilis]